MFKVTLVVTCVHDGQIPKMSAPSIMHLFDHCCPEFLVVEGSGMLSSLANLASYMLCLTTFALLQPKAVMDFTTDSAQERLDPQPVCADEHVANALGNGAWTCLEFLAVIIHASEQGEDMLQIVLQMLDAPMQAAPDVLLLGFGMLASMDASTIHRKLPSHVISNQAHKVINSQSPASRQVMSKLHAKAFPAFAYALQSAYQADPKSITTILSIVQVCIYSWVIG